jgi:N-acetylglucosamine kinase-like BadF-type ATPase
VHVIGIDAGGTKTVCMLADEEGRVVAEARGPGANLQASGELEVEKVLHTVMDQAIGDRAVVPDAIALGIAGVDRQDDAAVIRGIMRRIGAHARVLVVNDALVALVAGAGDDPGIVIIAGTGSIAYGRNAAGQAARAGGWGFILGDEGSGYWIGRRALRSVVRHADGRGHATLLSQSVLAHFSLRRPEELVHEIYQPGMKPSTIASLARLVQQAADEGDLVARRILEGATRELVLSAQSVTRQLRMQDEAFPFVLAGGILRAVPRLSTDLETSLLDLAPRARVTRLSVEPALGAVRLALAEARGGARLPTYGSAS